MRSPVISSGRPAGRWWLAGLGGLAVLVVFAAFVHPLLAVTSRVDADVLVVEGWVDDDILAAAAREFRQGNYGLIVTAGLEFEAGADRSGKGSYAAQAAAKLAALGTPKTCLISCPTPFVSWHRTSNSARAVREMLRARGVRPHGVNVLTAGPHGRETWVAYRRMLDGFGPVGVISVPNTSYDATWWWASAEGRRWVFKNIVGWPKEVLLGERS